MYNDAIATLVFRITIALQCAANAYNKDDYRMHMQRAAEYKQRLRVLKWQRFWSLFWHGLGMGI